MPITVESVESFSSFIKTANLRPNVKLRPHQEQAIKNTGDSAIIAHGVGSGKTLTGIAKFEELKRQGKAKKALVVVPAGLRDNFIEEGVKKFTTSKGNIVGNSQERSKKIYKGIDPGADYNAISYEMFRKNPVKYLKESGADVIISDEGHKFRNEGTATLDSFRKSRDAYKNMIILTGSVINNDPSDIQPLLDVVSRGKSSVGGTKSGFSDRYLQRSTLPKYKKVADKRKPVVGFKNQKELEKALSEYVDYMDYYDTKEIARMPSKTIKIHKVPLSKDQASLYRKLINDDPQVAKIIKNKRKEFLKDDEVNKAYNKMIEARKLVNNPGYFKPKMTFQEGVKASPKINRSLDDLTKHLKETPDGQAILLTNLIRGGADSLEQGLKNRGIDYGLFLGKQNPGSDEASRQQAKRDYLNRKKRVMVISGAGAEGLSLGNTTWEGTFDPHYNPERMKQMEARGVRAGGLSHRRKEDRNVEINRYLTTMPKKLGIFKSNLPTPDEFIYDIAQNKEQKNKFVFDLLKQTRQDKLNPPSKKEKVKRSVRKFLGKNKEPKLPKSSIKFSTKKPTVIKYGDF